MLRPTHKVTFSPAAHPSDTTTPYMTTSQPCRSAAYYRTSRNNYSIIINADQTNRATQQGAGPTTGRSTPVRPTNTSLALLKPKRVVPKKPLGLLTASILSGLLLGPGE